MANDLHGRCCAAIPGVALLAVLLACTPVHAGLEPVVTVEGITEYRLDNGLRVLLFPDQSKQKFTVNVTYMVGSRHEGRGEKGMAHLLEHMVFKGTDTYEDIWGVLQDHGAAFNGTTWVDRTNYYETLPAGDDNLKFALHMEADRMVNSRIAGEELEKEMTVVRNEFEMGENSPIGKLMERMISSAYLWHNYGQSTIGNRSDIERVPVANLRRFYERYYQPDNAMLVVAGKFDMGKASGWIEEYFGAIPRPERSLEATWTEEPTQDGPRFVELRRVGSNQASGAIYHICAGSHEDFPAVSILADILTSQPSGRVYQALVPDLAVGVNAFAFPWAEPGVMIVMAQSRTDQDVQAAHDRMLEVVEGLADSEITEEEVERARTRLLNSIKLALTDSGRIGIQLSESQALGDWRMYFIHRDRLKEVTVDDVRRVAASYLVESNRTSGMFIPTEDPVRAEIPLAPDVAEIVGSYTGTETITAGEAFEPTPENIERRTRRETIDNGMQVAMLSKETRGDAVVANFKFHYGTEKDLTGQTWPLRMVAPLLMRGTTRLDYQALQDEINRLQSRINVYGEAGTLGATIVSDHENFIAAIELLGEIVSEPAFPESEYEIVKKERLAGLETGLTDPQALTFNRMARTMAPFPKGSIHYVPTISEEIELVGAVGIDDVRDVYARFLGASNAEVSIVGDFDDEEVRRVLNRTFGSWTSPGPYARVERPYRPIEPMTDDIETPDKQMAVVAMGTALPIRDDDPDYPALMFANFVLGQNAKSRLLTALRHEGGLSYGAGSVMQVSSQDEFGALFGYAICAPQNAAKAQAKMGEIFSAWVQEGLTEEELVEGRQGYTLQYENRLANDEFIARQLVDDLEIGRTFGFHASVLRRVNNLTLDEIAAALKDNLSSATIVELKAGDFAAVKQ